MKITKAIIAVAGFGTRRLPITKSIEKCMLPIGNRPIVDYLVEDCAAAGITDIIFVVGEQHQQIKNYYAEQNQQLEDYLKTQKKPQQLQTLQNIQHNVKYQFVVQDRSQPYGTAVPVALCADLINDDEQVLFLAGDDFVYNPGGRSSIAQLLEAVQGSATCAMLSVNIPPSEVSKYGVVQMQGDAFVKIVEKPSQADAPSTLINISKYVFDKTMVNLATRVLSQPAANGECQITDALNLYVAEGKKVLVVPADGEYLDGGSLQGWLHANQRVVSV